MIPMETNRTRVLQVIRQVKAQLAREQQNGECWVQFFEKIPVPRLRAKAVLPEVPRQPDEFSELAQRITNCQACGLAKTRYRVVVGEGDRRARLVLVGEAPGVEEDKQGRPFVGAAGELLDRMLEAIGLKREQVYVCTVLKCRPPGNRNPAPEEIQACAGYLAEQLKALKPGLICALGTFAAQTLLGTQESLTILRERVQEYQGIPVVVTYHPAALLYHPQNKRNAWLDMKLIAKRLGLTLPVPPAKRVE